VRWGVCFLQAEGGIRYWSVTGVQTCALPICKERRARTRARRTDAATRSIAAETSAALAAPTEAVATGLSETAAFATALKRRPDRSEERRVGEEGGTRVEREC